MQVRLGWTGEVEPNRWSKADVTVDEGDLTRILVDAAISPAAAQNLSTKIIFTLLNNEAECLLLARLRMEGYPKDKADTRSLELEHRNEKILDAVRAKQA